MAKRRRSRRRKPKRQTKFATGKTGRRNYGTKSQPYAGVGALLVILLVFGGMDLAGPVTPYQPAAPGGQDTTSTPFYPFNDMGADGPEPMTDPGFPEGDAGYCSNLDKNTGASASTADSQGEPSGWPSITVDPIYSLSRECNSYDYIETSALPLPFGDCQTSVDDDMDGEGSGWDAASDWHTSRAVPVDEGCIALEDWSGDGTCDHRVFSAMRNEADPPLELHAFTHQYQGYPAGWVTVPSVPCMGWSGYHPY